jgi:hypothetical protein
MSCADPQCQQFADLFQREAQLLGAFDEAQARNIRCIVDAIAGLVANWLRQEPAPLVVAHGFDTDTRSVCKCADQKGICFGVIKCH